MRVLIACEESQRVCMAFRVRGHEAYSCDIQDCSGGHPEWHIKGDALKCLQGGAGVHVRRAEPLYRQVGFADCTSALHVFVKCRGLPPIPAQGGA